MGNPLTKDDPRINRRGRPKKGSALTDILNYKLDTKDDTGKLKREIIAEKIIELAIGDDIAALKYLIDRIYGKPKESMELTSGDVENRLK